MKFGSQSHQVKSIWINFGIEKSFKIVLDIGSRYDNLRTRSLETRECPCLAKAYIEYYILGFIPKYLVPRESSSTIMYILYISYQLKQGRTHTDTYHDPSLPTITPIIFTQPVHNSVIVTCK